MNINDLEIKNVRKSLKGNEVLRDVNITVKHGTIYALLGANGAGKSTVLKIVTGLLKNDGGKVTIKAIDVASKPVAAQRLFSFSSQNSTVDGVLTGYENLHLIAKLRHVSNPRNVAENLLAKFDLIEAKDKAVSTYSGGKRRRIDLAMSLVGNPEIIFLDEPTTGLDPKSRQELWETIKELKSEGKTIFLTTQYLEEADYLADQIGFLREGKIVASGTPDEMKRLAGSDKLLLVFNDQQDTERALKLLEVHSPTEKEEFEISIDLAEEIKTTMNVLNALTTENIELKNFKMITPTLDDVFMTLTKGEK